jgi:ribosomal protein L6P/L9E
MLWYGRKHKLNFTKTYKKRLQRHYVNLRRLAFSVKRKVNFGRKWYKMYIPSNWTTLVLKSKPQTVGYYVLYLTSQTYYFKVVLPLHGLSYHYDRQLHTIIIQAPRTSNFFPMYWNHLQTLLHSFSTLFFVKLKFKGKGYYLYKTARNTITTQFGHSHRIYIYSFFISVKFLSKTSVLFFGFSKRDILSIGYSLKSARPINLFTGRGVRFNRQILYRKTGKISTHR